MQLVAYGAQDVYLTGNNPQMTYFKSVFRRHTNFSIESILTLGYFSCIAFLTSLSVVMFFVHDKNIKLEIKINSIFFIIL